VSGLPEITFELKITFPNAQAASVKDDVISRLQNLGVDSFVEGALDGLDVDFDHDNPERDLFGENGGDDSPISVYKFDQEFLIDLKNRLTTEFANVTIQIASMATFEWTEGWKQGFKPITTDLFYVYPPWHKPAIPPKQIPIEMEPGMAFGTGQHATTRLCLTAIEKWAQNFSKSPVKGQSVLDVGTGTGILAIGCEKLGMSPVVGTDIDIDAVTSAKNNAAVNDVKMEVLHCGVPEDAAKTPYDLVIANIMCHVLVRLMGDLAAATKPNGYLILSGLLVTDEPEMLACCKSHGVIPIARYDQDGWLGLLMQVRR
jgi:ribosomal protein L11 methyltransferase